MAFDDLMRQLSVTLERDGNVHTVFGEAVKLEHHTIVPVAVVSAGGVGGEGDVGAEVGLNIRPVGFIHEQGDEVVFTQIHLDGGNRPQAAPRLRKVIALATSLVTRLAQRQPPKAEPSPTPGDGATDVMSPS